MLQLIIVYLGVIFADRSEKSNKEKIITWTTLIIGLGRCCGVMFSLLSDG